MAVRDESERESEEQRSEEAVRLGKAVEGLDTIDRSFVGLEQVCRLGLGKRNLVVGCQAAAEPLSNLASC